MEKSKIHGKTAQSLTYAQAANSLVNIKKVFSVLPNKKIIKIHNAVFPNLGPKNKKIQSITKGLFQKQVLVLVSINLANVIMEEANNHVFQVNSLLRNIKLTLRAEFICPCPGSIFINTNNIPNLSDLTVMECYLKSIEGAKNDKILVLCLSQSKLYLKITGILSQTSYGYIYQLFDNSHSLKDYRKPSKRTFNQYQSHFEAINIGQDIKQINQ